MEMPDTSLIALLLIFGVFQFSIGDAARIIYTHTVLGSRFNSPLEMRYRQLQYYVAIAKKTSFNSPLEMLDHSYRYDHGENHREFQFSIGDAGLREVVASLLERPDQVSILHWRCPSHDAAMRASDTARAGFNSPLEMPLKLAKEILEKVMEISFNSPLEMPRLGGSRCTT